MMGGLELVMEEWSMNKKILIGMVAALIAVLTVILGVIGKGAFSEGSFYYTRIDNNKIEMVHSRGGVIDTSGGMRYSYTLPAYDESGAEEEITFGTSRELREGAYLCLTVVPVRGVTDWKEVRFEELPEAARERYAGALPD